MQTDEQGYFYFMDRIGDTFRWKGENVSTSEVSEVISAFPGVRQCSVYGVRVPGTEGQAGMAAIVSDHNFDLAAFRTHLQNCLPQYAHPLVLRIRDDLEVTTTFKYVNRNLIREGYDPAVVSDVMYFNDRQSAAFVRLDTALYERLQTGQVHV